MSRHCHGWTANGMSKASSLAIALAAGLAFSTAALGEPAAYRCTGTIETGLHYDPSTGSWQPKQFKPRTYILRHPDVDGQDKEYKTLITDFKKRMARFRIGS